MEVKNKENSNIKEILLITLIAWEIIDDSKRFGALSEKQEANQS